MNMIRVLLLVCCGLAMPLVFAGELAIKHDGKTINVPYWPASEKQPHYGAVILAHGGAAEWSELLAHIAARLGRIGWSAVLLNCDADNSDTWVEQIPGVISTLRQNKNYRIVLIHYGEQLQPTIDYFTKPQAKMINGLILLSAFNEPQESTIPALRFPLFDITGQFDYDKVANQAAERKQQLQQRSYTLVEIPGAAHDYEYSRNLLVSFIHGWMVKIPEARPVPKPISYLVPVYWQQQLLSYNG